MVPASSAPISFSKLSLFLLEGSIGHFCGVLFAASLMHHDHFIIFYFLFFLFFYLKFIFSAFSCRSSTFNFLFLMAAKINCLICEKVIKEPEGKSKGHDSIFCDGTCQGWLHRTCAGIPKLIFQDISSSQDPFLCQCLQKH